MSTDTPTTTEPADFVAGLETPLGRPSRRGEPTWELAHLHPRQGEWTEREYLRIVDMVEGRVEPSDGGLEFLTWATLADAMLRRFLLRAFDDFCEEHAAEVTPLPPGMPVHLWEGTFRDPDMTVVRRSALKGNLERQPEAHEIAIAVELVCPDEESRKRTVTIKRREYAKAGIPEYWIVDPYEQCVSVLTLGDGEYRTYGRFVAGMQAASALLPGLRLDVTTLFAEAGE